MDRTDGEGASSRSTGDDEPDPRAKRTTRLQIMLAPDELRAVDKFRFEKHMPTRAAAVRELLRRGLAAAGFELAHVDSRSSDFGVLGDRSQSISDDD